MGESNKILSVTYGTFACRLEGFDDSVETMKAVVSYFHELAGHDRFMDMEPQAPALEELAELTQEHDDVPVEAIAETDHISLRALRTDAAPVEEEIEPVERPSLRIQRPERVVVPPVVEDFGQDDDVDHFGEDAAEDFQADDDALLEDVADEDANDANLVEVVAEEVHEEHIDADIADEDIVAEQEEDAPGDDDDVQEIHQDDVASSEGDASEPDAPYYDPAAEQEAAEASDSVAAKLERIRALVGRAPPANRPSPSAQDAAPAVGSVVDRLSALTGTTPPKPDAETEDLVDDFDFKPGSASPLVLSNDDDEVDAPRTIADVLDEDNHDTVDAVEDVADDVETAPEGDDQPSDEAAEYTAAETQEQARRRQNMSKRGNLPDNDDDAMSRIMTQADERLNEPEGRRHRDAFAQLKAAVAATEAARQLGDQSDNDDPSDAFREDLDEAVRSEEASAADAEEEEAPSEPAPLRLVAEQKIAEEETPADPADRLRQIAAVKESPVAPTEDFAEFAAQQGATELGDLLEAAAAYISYVEGDDDFSRPQVMKKVQIASAEEFSREDGLRSFGRLLRQNRIVKLSNGRFQVAGDTRFRPGGDQAAQG